MKGMSGTSRHQLMLPSFPRWLPSLSSFSLFISFYLTKPRENDESGWRCFLQEVSKGLFGHKSDFWLIDFNLFVLCFNRTDRFFQNMSQLFYSTLFSLGLFFPLSPLRLTLQVPGWPIPPCRHEFKVKLNHVLTHLYELLLFIAVFYVMLYLIFHGQVF